MLALIAVVAFAVLLTLKLASVVALSWLVVFSPLLILLALVVVIIVIQLVFGVYVFAKLQRQFR